MAAQEFGPKSLENQGQNQGWQHKKVNPGLDMIEISWSWGQWAQAPFISKEPNNSNNNNN